VDELKKKGFIEEYEGPKTIQPMELLAYTLERAIFPPPG
jgi:hypothetical protein